MRVPESILNRQELFLGALFGNLKHSNTVVQPNNLTRASYDVSEYSSSAASTTSDVEYPMS